MTDILTVDARGLTCPGPVLETKRVLERGLSDHFVVLVDNPSSRENVSRFAGSQGFEVEVTESGDDQYSISIKREADISVSAKQEDLVPCSTADNTVRKGNVVYVAARCMGSGDDELGAKLMRGFLRTLIDVPPVPWRIIFINSGVYLTTVDQEAVEALSILAEKGVEALSCGTCLQHFNLEDKLAVGKVTNMFEVIETFAQADKVISPD